jgi:hypothetical protein
MEAQTQVENTNQDQVFYYHSKFGNTPKLRQYSAAGRVVEKDGKKLLEVVYAVCSHKDVFNKHKAKLILDGRLRKGNKVITFAFSSEEEQNHPSRTFVDTVRNAAPLFVVEPSVQQAILNSLPEGANQLILVEVQSFLDSEDEDIDITKLELKEKPLPSNALFGGEVAQA